MEFAQALAYLVRMPVKTYIASDSVGVIVVLRSNNVEEALVHPVGYALASWNSGCHIIV